MKGWAQSKYFVSIHYFPGQILSIYLKMLLISEENWYNEELRESSFNMTRGGAGGDEYIETRILKF